MAVVDTRSASLSGVTVTANVPTAASVAVISVVMMMRRGGFRDDRRDGERRDNDRRDFGGRDDRRGDRGGYQRRDDRRGGFEDRGRGGFQQRDDRRGNYQRRDDDRRGGFRDDRRKDASYKSYSSTDEYVSPNGNEPTIPAGVSADELDRDALRALTTLSGPNRDIVARHLVMAGQLIDLDPEAAYQHAQAAVSRAGRVDGCPGSRRAHRLRVRTLRGSAA